MELKRKIEHSLLLISFTLGFLSIGNADVKVASIFSSNMVLQRGMAVPVWGTASAAETVIVDFNSQTVKTIADDEGKWLIKLSSMIEGGPYTMVVRGKNEVRFENILIGEVWICSGQSNMTFELKKTNNAKQDVTEATNPMIRLFTVKRIVSETPLSDCSGAWAVCSPEEAEDFSAVGYFFGKALQESLKIPIGLVHVSWGGTAAEGWLPKEVLESDSDFVPILTRWRKDIENYPLALKEFEEKLPAALAQWKIDSTNAVALGRAPSRKPTAPRGPGHRDTPTGQYNGMLYPIIPFAMRGVIWYQGEANASRAYQYRTLFPTLIRHWRNVWHQGDFPFYFVQLPNLDRQPEPSKSGWAELREAQLMTLNVLNTGMAVTIDVGDPKDLHPTNKKPVGERLAIIALSQTYGKSIEFSGPIFKSVTFGKKNIVVSFTHIGDGLTTKGNVKLAGFTVAGKDKKFVPVDAKIKGNEVIISNSKVKKPVSIRYAWADNPKCNLFNKNGLPASPFRTDEWEEVTFGKR